MFLGSQTIQNKKTGLNQINPAIRVNVENLAKVLEKDKLRTNITTRVVGGSIPPEKARVWEKWKSCDYKCILGKRTVDGKVSRILDSYHIKMTFPFFLGRPLGRYVACSNL